MSVHQFPAPAASGVPPRRFPVGPLAAEPDTPSCTLHWIGARLGHGGSDKRLVAYVQGLVDRYAFPRPYPSQVKGQGLTAAVTRHSRWDRAAVEAWLTDWLPPATAAALDSAARAAAADAMDDAAARLGAGGR